MSRARRRRETPGGGVPRPVAEAHRVRGPGWWPIEAYPDGPFVVLDGSLIPGMIGGFIEDRVARAVGAEDEAWSGLSADDALDFVFAELDHSPRITAPLE